MPTKTKIIVAKQSLYSKEKKIKILDSLDRKLSTDEDLTEDEEYFQRHWDKDIIISLHVYDRDTYRNEGRINFGDFFSGNKLKTGRYFLLAPGDEFITCTDEEFNNEFDDFVAELSVSCAIATKLAIDTCKEEPRWVKNIRKITNDFSNKEVLKRMFIESITHPKKLTKNEKSIKQCLFRVYD